MNVKKALIAVAVVAVLVVIVVLSLRSNGKSGPAMELEKVATRTVVSRVKGTGEVNPRLKVEVQAKVIGEIISLPVRAPKNSRVKP